ncbi:MAG: hypothetical protein WHS63_03855 [Tenuifilum sp.]|uniref:hypothetical protein n=1 Tax=Tenuifilum sp. TaxID=2760880 RepID=UPI0030A34059
MAKSDYCKTNLSRIKEMEVQRDASTRLSMTIVSRTTIHEQRKTPPAKLNMTKEVVFTPIRFFYQPSTNNCQLLPFSDSKKTTLKPICGQKLKYTFCNKHKNRYIKTMASILFNTIKRSVELWKNCLPKL